MPELGQDRPAQDTDVATAALEAKMVRNHRFFNRKFNRTGTRARTRPGQSSNSNSDSSNSSSNMYSRALYLYLLNLYKLCSKIL